MNPMMQAPVRRFNEETAPLISMKLPISVRNIQRSVGM
jgi:hypothetical protein